MHLVDAGMRMHSSMKHAQQDANDLRLGPIATVEVSSMHRDVRLVHRAMPAMA